MKIFYFHALKRADFIQYKTEKRFRNSKDDISSIKNIEKIYILFKKKFLFNLKKSITN